MILARRHTALACLVSLALARAASSQNWPQFRGPQRDGVAPDFTAPQTWPEKLTEVWRAPVGPGVSSPVALDGCVCVHTRKASEEVVSCFDAQSGKLIWTKSYAAPFAGYPAAEKIGKGPYSTPLMHAGKLYTLGVTEILSCFDAATGALVWRKDFGPIDISNMFTGSGMSPVMDAGNLIVHVGDDRGGRMLALDPMTGQEKWRWTGDGPGYASPIVIMLQNTRQIVTMTDKSAIAVAADSGKLLWRVPWPDTYNENIVTPVLYKDLVIFSGVRKGTLAVRPIREGSEWKPVEVWRNPDIAMYMSSPVQLGDRLFGLSDKRKGQFFSVQAATGKADWTTEGRDGGYAAIVKAKDTLFILTDEGKLTAARAGATGLERMKTYEVSQSRTMAHPVVFGRRILIKDEQDLTAWTWQY